MRKIGIINGDEIEDERILKNSSDLNEFDISCPLCVCLVANLPPIRLPEAEA